MKTIGDIVIDAVIRSGAIQRAESTGHGTLFVWSANAAEQIEAAIQEHASDLIGMLLDGAAMEPEPMTPRPAIAHRLKTLSPYFQAVKDGRKPFEIRRNDRDFRIGDTLELIEIERETMEETGDVIFRTVTYATAFAQRAGFIVLGITR